MMSDYENLESGLLIHGLSGHFGDTNLFGFTIDIYINKKQRLLAKLKQAKEEGKCMYDFHPEIIKEMLEFSVDTLCNGMKMKSKCSLVQYVITDNDTDISTRLVKDNPSGNMF
ncbi:hypothetical protein RO3G_05290 [Rhizopus delemar RA 99-880]|uniref:Uncharacterized protein n=1 Tax=Rhizopus delemar (strain RA 99-880 / ATCC MYA-4621 / FGSC 9543 / NRRL 43880) TaxID=246409 RepID=I1BWK5_RHIO9|nr:hypothetical protein RO3G_05290 [Rhizopus delemar RA 99-880]|eukprot:EIE80585.1 hypothetical protein RO3G_05290 [Rhizopus delemar RA 99-880]